MENKVTNQNILYGVVGVVLGILIAGQVANNNMGMMRTMGMGKAYNRMNQGVMDQSSQEMMGRSMMEMNDQLKGKTGDAFDKAFISNMIPHHQGAIDMANLAKQNAKHEEIMKMADDIITTQANEIDDMKEWHQTWYGSSVSY